MIMLILKLVIPSYSQLKDSKNYYSLIVTESSECWTIFILNNLGFGIITGKKFQNSKEPTS